MRRGEKRRAVARPLVTIAIVTVAAVALLGGTVSAAFDIFWG
jgi:hypothetical protein